MHLFEWEDQPWLPAVFRDFITDHLRYSHSEPMREPVNAAIASRLAALVRQTGSEQIIDLCAGAGGPITQVGRLLAQELSTPIPILVTDLYPNVAAFRALEVESGGLIRARYESTNAADVSPDLRGVRTLFTALHHFRPAGVRAVLADAVKKRAPIAVFEPLERTVRMMALVGLMSFLRGFTHTHIVANLTARRTFCTYFLPLAPAMFAWDGFVSTLRTYTAEELLQLARSVDDGRFRWEAGRFDLPGPYGSMPTTFLTGIPA